VDGAFSLSVGDRERPWFTALTGTQRARLVGTFMAWHRVTIAWWWGRRGSRGSGLLRSLVNRLHGHPAGAAEPEPDRPVAAGIAPVPASRVPMYSRRMEIWMLPLPEVASRG
jgi:hypothetical protein